MGTNPWAEADASSFSEGQNPGDARHRFLDDVRGDRFKLPKVEKEDLIIDFNVPLKADAKEEAPKAGKDKAEQPKPEQNKPDGQRKDGVIKLEAKDFEKLGPELGPLLKKITSLSVCNIPDGKHFELTREQPITLDLETGSDIKVKMGTKFAADVRNLGPNKLLIDSINGLSIEVPTPDNKAFGKMEVTIKKATVDKNKDGQNILTLTTEWGGKMQDVQVPLPPGNTGLSRAIDTLKRVASNNGSAGGDRQDENDLLKQLTLGLIGLGVSGIVGGAAFKIARGWRAGEESKTADGSKPAEADKAGAKPAGDGMHPIDPLLLPPLRPVRPEVKPAGAKVAGAKPEAIGAAKPVVQPDAKPEAIAAAKPDVQPNANPDAIGEQARRALFPEIKPGIAYFDQRRADVRIVAPYANKDVVLVSAKGPDDRPLLEEVARQQSQLGNHKEVKHLDKTYLCNTATGEVLLVERGREGDATSKDKYFHVKDMVAKTFEATSQDMKAGAKPPAWLETVSRAFDSRESGKLGISLGDPPKDVHYEVLKTSVDDRAVLVGTGSHYLSPGADGWFRPDGMPKGEPNPNFTIRVGVTGFGDLAKVQAALLPKLAEQMKPGGELHGKLLDVTTQDPLQAVSGKYRLQNGELQKGNVGFVLYPADASAAKTIQELVDKTLVEAGLTDRSAAPPTGDLVHGGSGRVAVLVHEHHWEAAKYKGPEKANADRTLEINGAYLPADMEREVIEFMHKQVESKAPGWEKFATIADLYTVGERSSIFYPEALQALEKAFGLDGQKTQILQADSTGEHPGRLMLSTTGQRMINGKVQMSEVKDSVVDTPDGKRYSGAAAIHNIGRVVSDALKSKTATPIASLANTEAENSKPVKIEQAPIEPILIDGERSARFVERIKAEGPFSDATAIAVDKLQTAIDSFMIDERISRTKLLRQFPINVEFSSTPAEKTTVVYNTCNEPFKPVVKTDRGFYCDNKPIAADKVAVTIRMPESLLKDPAKLAKELYKNLIEQSSLCTLTKGQAAPIDTWMQESFGKTGSATEKAVADSSAGTVPEINLPLLDVTKLPDAVTKPLMAKLSPNGIRIGNGRTEQTLPELWEKTVMDHLNEEYRLAELSGDQKRIDEVFDKRRAEEAFLSKLESSNNKAALEEARSRLSTAMEKAAAETAKPGAHGGHRGRAVAVTQLMKYLLK